MVLLWHRCEEAPLLLTHLYPLPASRALNSFKSMLAGLSLTLNVCRLLCGRYYDLDFTTIKKTQWNL